MSGRSDKRSAEKADYAGHSPDHIQDIATQGSSGRGKELEMDAERRQLARSAAVLGKASPKKHTGVELTGGCCP